MIAVDAFGLAKIAITYCTKYGHGLSRALAWRSPTIGARNFVKTEKDMNWARALYLEDFTVYIYGMRVVSDE